MAGELPRHLSDEELKIYLDGLVRTIPAAMSDLDVLEYVRKEILKRFASSDIQAKNISKETMIHRAIKLGVDNRIIKALILLSREPLGWGGYFSYDAVNDNDTSGLKNLLHYAAETGNADLINLLMKMAGENFIASRQAQAVKDCLNLTAEGKTPLYYAIQSGNMEAVKALIAGGADHNKDVSPGMKATHYAAQLGSLEILRYLLETLKMDPLELDAKGRNIHKIIADLSSERKEDSDSLGRDLKTVEEYLGAYQEQHKDVLHVLKGAFSIQDNPEQLKKYFTEIAETPEGKFFLENLNKKYKGLTPIEWGLRNGAKAPLIDALLNLNPSTDLNNIETPDGNAFLHVALNNGDLAVAKVLLARGSIDVNLKSKNTGSPLHYAIRSKNEACIDLILKHPSLAIDSNAVTGNGKTPLMYAVQNRLSVKILMELMEVSRAKAYVALRSGMRAVIGAKLTTGYLGVKNRFNSNILHFIARSGNVDYLNVLLEGAKKDGNLAISSLMTEDTRGRNPFYYALVQNNKEMTERLIHALGDKSVDFLINIDSIFKNALNLAIARNNRGSIHAIQELVDKLSREKQEAEKDKLINGKDEYGLTPIYYAIKDKNLELVQWLVKNGANLNVEAEDKKNINPMHYAARNGALEILKYLRSIRSPKTTVDTIQAALIKRDKLGRTLLHHSAMGGHLEMTQYLLDNPPIPRFGEILNNGGRTPLHSAAMRGKKEVVQLLLDRYPDHIRFVDEEGDTPFSRACLRARINLDDRSGHSSAAVNVLREAWNEQVGRFCDDINHRSKVQPIYKRAIGALRALVWDEKLDKILAEDRDYNILNGYRVLRDLARTTKEGNTTFKSGERIFTSTSHLTLELVDRTDLVNGMLEPVMNRDGTVTLHRIHIVHETAEQRCLLLIPEEVPGKPSKSKDVKVVFYGPKTVEKSIAKLGERVAKDKVLEKRAPGETGSSLSSEETASLITDRLMNVLKRENITVPVRLDVMGHGLGGLDAQYCVHQVLHRITNVPLTQLGVKFNRLSLVTINAPGINNPRIAAETLSSIKRLKGIDVQNHRLKVNGNYLADFGEDQFLLSSKDKDPRLTDNSMTVNDTRPERDLALSFASPIDFVNQKPMDDLSAAEAERKRALDRSKLGPLIINTAELVSADDHLKRLREELALSRTLAEKHGLVSWLGGMMTPESMPKHKAAAPIITNYDIKREQENKERQAKKSLDALGFDYSDEMKISAEKFKRKPGTSKNFEQIYASAEYVFHQLVHDNFKSGESNIVPLLNDSGDLQEYVVHPVINYRGMVCTVLTPRTGTGDVKIYFRGTEPSEGLSVKRDLAEEGAGFTLFKGKEPVILKMINSILGAEQERRRQEGFPPDLTVSVGGHSLGGADAQYCFTLLMKAMAMNKRDIGTPSPVATPIAARSPAAPPAAARAPAAPAAEIKGAREIEGELPGLYGEHISTDDRNHLGNIRKLRLQTFNAPGVPYQTADEALEFARYLKSPKPGIPPVELEIYHQRVAGDIVQRMGKSHVGKGCPSDILPVTVLKFTDYRSPVPTLAMHRDIQFDQSMTGREGDSLDPAKYELLHNDKHGNIINKDKTDEFNYSILKTDKTLAGKIIQGLKGVLHDIIDARTTSERFKP